MKIGVIGFGVMGQIRLNTLPQVSAALNMQLEVSKIYEYSDELRLKIPRDILACDNPGQIIEDPEIEAIFVCAPNFMTKDLVLSSLENGKHVFAEKPPGINSSEAMAMKNALEAHPECKLMFGFNHRHHDSMLHAKDLIESGEFGKLLWMRGRYGKTVTENYKTTWRAKRKYAGGGIFLDQGIHMLDLFLMMAGDFNEVKADVSSLFWGLDVEDNVFAIFKNEKGQVASLHSTMTQWRHLFSFEIFLEKGHIVINGLLTNSGSYGAEKMSVARNFNPENATWSQEETATYRVNSSWLNEMKLFFSCIKQGKEIPMGNIDDALKLMKLVDKVYEVGR